MAGHAAQDHLAQPRMAERAHDDQIRLEFPGGVDQRLAGRAVARLDQTHVGVDAMPGQRGRERLDRVAFDQIVERRRDLHRLRLFQKRHRGLGGTARLHRVVPEQRNPLAEARQFAPRREQHRPAGVVDRCLGARRQVAILQRGAGSTTRSAILPSVATRVALSPTMSTSRAEALASALGESICGRCAGAPAVENALAAGRERLFLFSTWLCTMSIRSADRPSPTIGITLRGSRRTCNKSTCAGNIFTNALTAARSTTSLSAPSNIVKTVRMVMGTDSFAILDPGDLDTTVGRHPGTALI
ncbi:MAG: hypothetical protein H6844_02450 [Alphaproteobacteria bacterium]|nr:hypothetical protein [Alphaproteobacteria bacterium]